LTKEGNGKKLFSKEKEDVVLSKAKKSFAGCINTENA